MNEKFIARFGKSACIVLLALTATGCRDAGDQALPPAEASGKPPAITLRLAMKEYVDPNRLNSLIAAYEEQYPNVKVELLNLPAERYNDSLHMMMTSGEGPDLFQASTEWLTTYTFKNWLLDLSELVDEQLLGSYPAWAVDYTKDHSRFYAVPAEMMTLRLIYNKELFRSAGLDPDRPPATLAELERYAAAISKAGAGYRIYGFALPGGDSYSYQQALEMASTYSGVYHYHYASGEYDFSGYEKWFDAMLKMKKSGGMFPGESSLGKDTALTQFAEGYIGMMYVTSRDYATLNGMRAMKATRVGIAMPPLYEADAQPGGALMVSLQAPIAIHAHTGHREEAAALWELLHAEDYIGSLYGQGDTIPISRAIAGNDLYQPNLDQFEAFLPGSEESPYPKEPKFIMQHRLQSRNEHPDFALRTRMYEDIMLGVQPVEAALAELTLQYNSSLDQAAYRSVLNKGDYIYSEFNPLQPMGQTP